MQNQTEAPKVQKPAKENPETVILRALNSGNQKVRKYLLDEVFYEPPVGVREFLRSPDYFNLEGVMYESIMQLLEYVGQPEIREAVLEIGRGSGKSYGCSGYLGYQEYWLNNLRHPQLFYDKAPSTLISCLNVSISASQAESVIFGDLAEMIGNSKWFKGKFKMRKKEIEFPMSHTRAIAGHSGSTAWRGYPVFAAVADEINFFKDKKGKSNAEEMWAVLLGSCQTRFPDSYKLLAISSSREDGDFTDRYGKSIRTGNKVVLPFMKDNQSKSKNSKEGVVEIVDSIFSS